LKRLIQSLEKPIDIAPLIYARIVVGLLVGIELSFGIFNNYSRTLIEPQFHFSYILTPFISPWQKAEIIYIHFILNFILGLLFASGLFFRWVRVLFLLSTSSLFLMEKSLYINHFYLYSLFLFLFLFLPANRAYSVDTLRKPTLKASQVPAWTIYILLFQISIVYIYASFAKLNTDWLHAQPIKIWLASKANYPIIGSILSSPTHAYLVAYGGILFDLLIVFFMIKKSTRKFAFFVCCFFHISNAITFGVGTFPWFSIAITALFFPANNFRKWKLKNNLPPLGYKTVNYGNRKKIIYGILGVYIILQLLIPLRQHLFSGNTSWTEEGHYFSWRMMLRSKQSTIHFIVKDANTNKTERINLNDYLNYRQIRKMGGNPDMILQFAHFLKTEYATKKDFKRPLVYARNRVTMNARLPQEMIKKGIDLGNEVRSLSPYTWVIPLKKDNKLSF